MDCSDCQILVLSDLIQNPHNYTTEVFKYLGEAVPVEGLDASARFGGQLTDLLADSLLCVCGNPCDSMSVAAALKATLFQMHLLFLVRLP